MSRGIKRTGKTLKKVKNRCMKDQDVEPEGEAAVARRVGLKATFVFDD